MSSRAFQVRLSHSAARYLERQPRDAQRRINERLGQLGDNPFGSYAKPLKGAAGNRSSRVGSRRIIFTVDLDLRFVDVSTIGPRGQVYRQL